MIIYLRYYKLTPKGEANQSGSCFFSFRDRDAS